MTTKPCIVEGCRNTVVPGRARCRRHGSGSTWEGYAERHPERVLRYASVQWKTAREQQLKAHPDCQWPGCAQPATQADHIVAIADGGEFGGPLQSLCAPHHRKKTAADAKARAARRKGNR